MTEVLFRGEYVEESLVNLWLSKPENQGILEEEEAKEKAKAAEERKQLQKLKLAENRLKEKKIQECLQKVRAELPPDVHYDDDPKTHAYLLERAHNMYYNCSGCRRNTG